MGIFSEIMEEALEEKDAVIRERDERIKRLEQRIEQQRTANRGMARDMRTLSALRLFIERSHSEGHSLVRVADLLELLGSTDNKSEGGEKGVNPPPLPSGGCTGASEPPG
jgi:hypothetical protein